MNVKQYLDIKEELIRIGYAEEIDWATSVTFCEKSLNFFREYGWVVINSGMKNQIAKKYGKELYVH